MDKQPLMQPLDYVEMHAPIEVVITVRMVLADGSTGRVMYEMHPGVIPTRAAILDAIGESLVPTNEHRPMPKPEFVAFITKRATGEAIPMAGEQNFVPVTAEIPHAMLVHAVAGTTFEYSNEGFAKARQYSDCGLLETVSSGHGGVDVNHYWDRRKLAKLADSELMGIYKRVTA